MKAIQSLRFLKSYFSLVRDPRKTENVFRLAEIVSSEKSELVTEVTRHISSFSSFNQLYEEKYTPALPNLDELSKLPNSTLGGAYARHMHANGLKADFFPHTKNQSKRDYFIERARSTHDVWHVMTGFDTSVEGEVALQAFALAQTRSPLSALVVAGGILHTLIFNKSIYMKMIDRIFSGYQMGKRAEFFLGVKFEEKWNADLLTLRNELRVEAG